MGYKLLWLGLFVLILVMVAYGRTSRKKKVVFLGDSITQLGLGQKGYITLMNGFVRQEGLEENLELVGAGISGNKVYDLYLRLEEDVLSKAPDIVVIYVGVNDVWHKRLLGTGTDFDKFGTFYKAIVTRLRAANIKVIVCTPAVIGERTDHSNEQDGDLNLYSGWIRDYASKQGLGLADLRNAFISHNLGHNKENKEKGILTTDRVHLNDAGNTLVATEIWKAIRAAVYK